MHYNGQFEYNYNQIYILKRHYDKRNLLQLGMALGGCGVVAYRTCLYQDYDIL